MKKLSALILSLLLIFLSAPSLLTSCERNTLYSEGDGNLNVVCTVFPAFDLVKETGGEKITVTMLQSNGADLHNYSPTTAALAAISKADIFVCVGGESDSVWVNDIVSASQNPDLKILRLTECVDKLLCTETDHEHSGSEHTGDNNHSDGNEHTGDNDHFDSSEHADHTHTFDEHVWTSPKNAILIINEIKKALSEADSENSDYYNTRAEAYKAKLALIDSEYEKAVSEAKNKTVVFADRFPFIYLTNHYGISYHAAFSGCSTEINADFETQVRLINTVKELSLSSIIVLEDGAPELAKNICAETGCNTVTLNSMQSTSVDEIKNGATYLKIMTSNLEALKEALK